MKKVLKIRKRNIRLILNIIATLAAFPLPPRRYPWLYLTGAVVVIGLYGEAGTGPLLILSQVVLSLQLPFAVFPLVMFTSDAAKMGRFVSPLWMRALAWLVSLVIAVLNVWLLYQTFATL